MKRDLPERLKELERQLVEVTRMTAPDALRWVADQCDVRVAEIRMNDWVGVLIKSNVRSRIETLLEMASMCRAKAKLLEEGKKTPSVDVPKEDP